MRIGELTFHVETYESRTITASVEGADTFTKPYTKKVIRPELVRVGYTRVDRNPWRVDHIAVAGHRLLKGARFGTCETVVFHLPAEAPAWAQGVASGYMPDPS